MIQEKLQKIINRQLERTLDDEFNGDYEDFANNFYEITQKEIYYGEILEAIFNYIIEVKGEDPFEAFFDESWVINQFGAGDTYELLNDSGWIDKYFNVDYFFIKPNKINGYKESKPVYDDIKIEGDRIYLICDKWDTLSILFESSNRDLVERILGEDWSELYGWFDTDFESDVWDNLDEKSLQHIKEYIIENDFIGKELDYDEDPNEEGLRLDMLEDTDLMGELIDNESMFDELKRELENFYRWAYEGAAEDELFGEIDNEIQQLLGSKGEWDVTKSNEKDVSDKHFLKFDITNIFMDFNRMYLKCWGRFPRGYESSFIDVIADALYCEGEELSGPNMDYFYPDSTKVAEHLNYNVLGNL